MREKVKEILRELKGEWFDFEEKLITGGYISSFELIVLISMIEDSYKISISVTKLQPEDFDDIDGICSVIKNSL